MPRLALLFVLLVAGCDRFADDEAVVAGRVLDASGQPVPGADIYFIPRFDPPIPATVGPPGYRFRFRLTSLVQVSAEIRLLSTGARVYAFAPQRLEPGPHTLITPPGVLSNGFYEAILYYDGQERQRDRFALYATAGSLRETPSLTRSDNQGRFFLDPDLLRSDETFVVTVNLDSVQVRPTNTVDIVALRSGRPPAISPVTLQGQRTVRVELTMQ